MIELGAHAGFIAAAYGVVTLGVGGVIAYILLRGRTLSQRLDTLERQGVRRRSERRS
jgi:heme exporter protein D